MVLKALFIPVLSAFSLGFFDAIAKSAEKELDFKAVKHFQITLETAVYAVYRKGNIVMDFPGESAFYIRSDYNPDAREQDLAFGTLHNPYDGSERIDFEPKDKQRRIRSVIREGSRWGFLDVKSMQLMIWDEDRKAWQIPMDLILDTPRPPRDSRGEPTRAETTAMRSRLVKSLAKEKGNADLIAGLTDIPKGWKDKDGSQYVLWMRGGSQPLMTLKCDFSSFRVCQVQRACKVSGLSAAEAREVSSIALDSREQTLLVLMGGKQKIKKLAGSSCAGLAAKDGWRLPTELRNAQGIFVDSENNFWLAMREGEGATSASVFSWDAKSW